MEFPLVSIIVPMYNTAGCIARCVKSICAQTYKSIEVRLAKVPPAIRAKSTAIPQNDGKTDAADQARCFSNQLPISSNTS